MRSKDLTVTDKTKYRFSLQHVVASVRSFSRWQHAKDILQQPLGWEIDVPSTYRLTRLPRALPWPHLGENLQGTFKQVLRVHCRLGHMFGTAIASFGEGRIGSGSASIRLEWKRWCFPVARSGNQSFRAVVWAGNTWKQ